MEKQLELDRNRVEHLRKLSSLIPDVLGAYRGVISEVYKDGALSGKMKRLMSLSIALGAGCRNCVLGQARYALDAGATREEIMETLSVVISMRGTTGVAESLRIVQFLEEIEKQP
ncbi:MAG: carboxymuconolactone decarboxylase family protein [Deltaproteobacteria bacterium]|nr:carboxymuconolactone decarboxylase family protein [Deltaproteobacteria bacterium]